MSVLSHLGFETLITVKNIQGLELDAAVSVLIGSCISYCNAEFQSWIFCLQLPTDTHVLWEATVMTEATGPPATHVGELH